MSQQQLQAQLPKHGLVIELNSNGDIIRSLHDPTGQLFSSVSEVEEENNVLYLGSNNRNFVGRLNLSQLPPPMDPATAAGTGGTGTGGTGTGGTGTAPNPNSGTGQLHFCVCFVVVVLVSIFLCVLVSIFFFCLGVYIFCCWCLYIFFCRVSAWCLV